MKHNNFARQRNRWPRVLVVAMLISLNLTPVFSQDLIPPRPALPCRFCPRPGSQIEPQAGRWKTWVLNSGSQFRLPPPPDGLAQEIEIRSLITRAGRRDDTTLDAISFWDSGPPGYRWNEIATNSCSQKQPNRATWRTHTCVAERGDLRRDDRRLGLEIRLQPPASERGQFACRASNSRPQQPILSERTCSGGGRGGGGARLPFPE